ncbi:MAG: type I restriction enzyme HsdR N-terminal domain-containing protein [Thiotrichaceae bacterium]
MTMNQLFKHFDFAQLNSLISKEDSVREVLILPLLQRLGYEQSQIVRSKALSHPFLKIGSKKRPITLIPDYLLKVADNYAWVLDAKAPHEAIKYGDNVEQIYSYSIHPEVRTKFFALCNGRAFALFRQDVAMPILDFELVDIADYFEELQRYLSPNSFQSGKTFNYVNLPKMVKNAEFDYLNRPLLEEIEVKKQAAKRHFGVHGYFTKQAWNVVQRYIQHFSQKGDLVLDPFGGSGVTAIEAMMTDRRAIHLDLNPMSAFLVDSLTRPVKLPELQESFERVKNTYKSTLYQFKTPSDFVTAALKKYPYPKNFTLPKGSDVEVVQELFSQEQLAQLSVLKYLILQDKDENIRKTLLLTFSSTITKTNLTYHNSKQRNENAGDCAMFRYYRHRLAPKNVSLDLMTSFETKFKKILNAKREIESKINPSTIDNLQIIQGSATNLVFLQKKQLTTFTPTRRMREKDSLFRPLDHGMRGLICQ